jgi:hypothetical protein
MPRRRGETDEQWMERLRDHRERETMMARTRGAVCFLNATNAGRHSGTTMAAFLDIFHPEFSDEQTLRLCMDAQKHPEGSRR